MHSKLSLWVQPRRGSQERGCPPQLGAGPSPKLSLATTPPGALLLGQSEKVVGREDLRAALPMAPTAWRPRSHGLSSQLISPSVVPLL